MRIMALILASALAVCFMNPASAATKHSSEVANPDRPVYHSSEVANPDRSVYPATRGCTTYC